MAFCTSLGKPEAWSHDSCHITIPMAWPAKKHPAHLQLIEVKSSPLRLSLVYSRLEMGPILLWYFFSKFIQFTVFQETIPGSSRC